MGFDLIDSEVFSGYSKQLYDIGFPLFYKCIFPSPSPQNIGVMCKTISNFLLNFITHWPPRCVTVLNCEIQCSFPAQCIEIHKFNVSHTFMPAKVIPIPESLSDWNIPSLPTKTTTCWLPWLSHCLDEW